MKLGQVALTFVALLGLVASLLASTTPGLANMAGPSSPNNSGFARAEDPPPSPEDLGLTSPSTWEGPFDGAVIEWSSNWVFEGGPRNAGINEDDQWVHFKLYSGTGLAFDHQVAISSRPNREGLTAQQVAYRTARQGNYTLYDVLIRRHGESSVVLTRMPSDDDNPVVIYDEIFLTGDGDFIVEFHLSFKLENAEPDYLHFAGEITVDGIPVGQALTVDEIVDASEHAGPMTILGERTIDSFQEFKNRLLSILDTYGDAGMTWTNEYESPNHGYTVTWNTNRDAGQVWQLNEPTDANGDVIPAVTTSPDGADSLSLRNRSTSSLATIFSQTTDDAPIDVLEEQFAFCEELDGYTCEVVLSIEDDDTAALVVLIESDDGLTWLYYLGGAMIDDGTLQMVYLQASGDWFADIYAGAQETMTINGEPLPLLFDDDEIAELA